MRVRKQCEEQNVSMIMMFAVGMVELQDGIKQIGQLFMEGDVYIWADNDEAGIKCANEIAKELKANGSKVKVIQPPETF